MRLFPCLSLTFLACISYHGAMSAPALLGETKLGEQSQASPPLPPSRPSSQPALLEATASVLLPDQAMQGTLPAPSLRTAESSAPVKPVLPNERPVITVSQDPQPTFDAATFINTMRAAWTYKRHAEAGGWPLLPAGTVLKIGDKGPLITTLRQRLLAEGDLPTDQGAGEIFDAALKAAVTRFQARHGLAESGAVRARTLAALNVPALARHRQLTASAQRLIGSAFSFGERYVVVNIPSATVEAVEAGHVVRRYVAVVGKTDRPSPMVETKITAVNLNPTWTVPVSLIKKDIIPRMRADPAYLTKLKIRILDGKGQEVEPRMIDWSTEQAVNYTLRQDPGAINSLGQIRIDMPNKEAVYLHDTPSKRLFAQDERFHSSGCVRVADVTGLAEWLLRDTAGAGGAWTRSSLEAAIATQARQDIRLSKAVPVAWIYLTGYATADGTVHFRDDVYGLDKPKAGPLPEPGSLDVPVTSAIAPKRSL